ncbi:hypothetical protein MVES1_001338 [Malassezia vespertilionis]|uniref:GH16 domain-containing protein n=1 Tax=Malassezia vespertilionis TaxID=2020962 RepID=A0A2N1JEJ1_9BASI|nr:uncharacterized protein MVES1_001338 [Malassezia vespertilionis]PKI84936.1 hypothetical protein MVES_001257 [Malassezia vespertilionis]WFD06000.1 hypothetical protein MVES1_001338 [Malassezia vespertilionis]
MPRRYDSVPSAPEEDWGPHAAKPRNMINTPQRQRARRVRPEAPSPPRPAVPQSVLSSGRSKSTAEPPSDDLQTPTKNNGYASSLNSTRTTPEVRQPTAARRPRPFSNRQSVAPRKGMVVLHPMQAEPDDYLHIPDKNPNERSMRPSVRGVMNVLTLVVIALALFMLFAGYPIIANMEHVYNNKKLNAAEVVLSENAQIPTRGLIDSDTPQNARTWHSVTAKEDFDLVFSDEFTQDGRTFWPGDDPFFEAVDLYYLATQDYEWYSPEMITTVNGRLRITMDNYIVHNTNFRSGMLQTWNKFCFQGGYVETSVVFPKSPSTQGYWPGFWLMGNLGRAGYLASTDGMWPYSYDQCDVGIWKNQSYNGVPEATKDAGTNGDAFSYLPGMRYPSCTCSNEDHPGPNNKVARSAPELDIFEVQVTKGESFASQSFQLAPFDYKYNWYHNTSAWHIFDPDVTSKNVWSGSNLQEALSCVTKVPDSAFEDTEGVPTKIGVEYNPDLEGNGDGYITYYVDGKPSWHMDKGVLSGNDRVQIGERMFPKEPMYIIVNLGIAKGFQSIKFSGEDKVQFPAQMELDYIRVYQPSDKSSARYHTCDPPDYPTANFISKHANLYQNNNLTQFTKAGYKWPKNTFNGGKC